MLLKNAQKSPEKILKNVKKIPKKPKKLQVCVVFIDSGCFIRKTVESEHTFTQHLSVHMTKYFTYICASSQCEILRNKQTFTAAEKTK